MKKKTTGRPRKEFNVENFEGLCKLQCTLEEIAGFLDLSEDTVERRCVEIYGQPFAEVFRQKSAHGRISLRRTQFRLAEKSYVMALWLGKQYLGQSDKVTLDKAQLDKLIQEIEEGYASERESEAKPSEAVN